MIRVTWAWLGQAPALDLANTVAVENGLERDLLAPAGAYERWVAAEVAESSLAPEELAALLGAKRHVVAIRTPIRTALAAVAAGTRPPAAVIRSLNAASRATPDWLEFDLEASRLETKHAGRRSGYVVAKYARSALLTISADGNAPLRVCGAPSCGMFYRPARVRQLWCSEQCGTRARVARAYRTRHDTRRPASRSRTS